MLRGLLRRLLEVLFDGRPEADEDVAAGGAAQCAVSPRSESA